MAWVKLDDQIADHPKMIAVGPMAAWLYVCGLTYCNRYLTDGVIPIAQAPRLADIEEPAPLIARLVEVGLWVARRRLPRPRLPRLPAERPEDQGQARGQPAPLSGLSGLAPRGH
jgi:hypothetical protein